MSPKKSLIEQIREKRTNLALQKKGNVGLFGGTIFALVVAVIGIIILIITTGMGANFIDNLDNGATGDTLAVYQNGTQALTTGASNFDILFLAVIFIGIIGLLIGVVYMFGRAK